MGVLAHCTLSNQALYQGRSEIGPVTGAVEGKVCRDRLRFFRATPAQDEPEAFAVALGLRDLAAQQHRAPLVELGLETPVHFERQTMAMRIPQGTHMLWKIAVVIPLGASPFAVFLFEVILNACAMVQAWSPSKWK